MTRLLFIGTVCSHKIIRGCSPLLLSNSSTIFKVFFLLLLFSRSAAPQNSTTLFHCHTHLKMSAQKEYSALPNNSSAEPLLNADEFYYNNSQTQKGYRRHILRITHAIYLAAITAVLVFFLYTSKSSSYLDCTREANAWRQST